MKFVHIADLHLDTPFKTIGNLGNKRRLDQRSVFRKIIDYIKENKVECLFIAGDLYEQEYTKETTIEYINSLFTEIKETKIFIAPGNHDPYLSNSFYNSFKWSDNVYIFKDKVEKIQLNDSVNIYGYGFSDFYVKDTGIEDIKIDEKNKVNILVTHASLDAGHEEDKVYNPLSSSKIKLLGFDYVALGHIHKRYISDDQRIVYPGSTISMGFDELGEHGMIVGDINEKNINIEFIKLDNIEFIEKNIDISDIYSQEELIEKILINEFKEDRIYKLVLIGDKNFDVNVNEILKLVNVENVIKIKDKSEYKIDYEKIANINNLKGIFVKELLSKLNEDELNNEKIKKAIEIGISILGK